MALKRVKYEDEEGVYRVEGGGEAGIANDGAIVMPIDTVADVSVAHFERRVLRRRCREPVHLRYAERAV
jgi:hypothetical protein